MTKPLGMLYHQLDMTTRSAIFSHSLAFGSTPLQGDPLVFSISVYNYLRLRHDKMFRYVIHLILG